MICSMLHRFIDDELTNSEADAFRAHLPDCAACRRETSTMLQLDALVRGADDSDPREMLRRFARDVLAYSQKYPGEPEKVIADVMAISPDAERLATSEAARVAAEERARVLGEALTAAQPFVERAAEEDQSYGYFLGGLVGGDPRQFSPDEECATATEIAQHKADCEAWDRGERPVHRVMTPIDPTRSIAGQLKGSDSAMLERDAEGNVTGGHVHHAGYGLGVTVFRDPEAVAALAKVRDALSSLPTDAPLPAGEVVEARKAWRREPPTAKEAYECPRWWFRGWLNCFKPMPANDRTDGVLLVLDPDPLGEGIYAAETPDEMGMEIETYTVDNCKGEWAPCVMPPC